MDIINTLYSEYINDNQYVYYKEHDTIIIMKKLTDDNKCLSDIEPKKYHSSSLKVILMFNITDPYKLVYNLSKYKINEITDSYYYDNIKEAYTLRQFYHYNLQKWNEINFNKSGKSNGFYQEYYENGNLKKEYNIFDDEINGLYQEYYKSGKLKIKSNYIDGKKNGLHQQYYESGQLEIECNYINNTLNGLYQGYYESGKLKYECNYINYKKNGLYQEYYQSGQLKLVCNYIDGYYNGLYKEYSKSGQLKYECHF